MDWHPKWAACIKCPREELLSSLPVWKDLAHSVFNLKEFIYIQ